MQGIETSYKTAISPCKAMKRKNKKSVSSSSDDSDTNSDQYNPKTKICTKTSSKNKKQKRSVKNNLRVKPSLVNCEQVLKNCDVKEEMTASTPNAQLQATSTANIEVLTNNSLHSELSEVKNQTDIPLTVPNILLTEQENSNESPLTLTENLRPDTVSGLNNSDLKLETKIISCDKIDLTECDSDDSKGSVKTVIYDYSNLSTPIFSPIPSTSKDNDTIMKNDKLLHDSLLQSQCDISESPIPITLSNDENTAYFDDKDVMIIETPIHTIVIEDVPKSNHQLTFSVNKDENPVIDIDEYIRNPATVRITPDIIEISDINLTADQSQINETSFTNRASQVLTNTSSNNNWRRNKRTRIHRIDDNIAMETLGDNITNQNSCNEILEKENLLETITTPSLRIGKCPICMDPLDKDIASTMCGHLFCMECLKSSLKMGSNKCPTCRKNISKKNGYHQIFI